MHENDIFSEDLLCTLAMVAGEENVLMAEPMSKHTTFKIGGSADIVVTPSTREQLVGTLDFCEKCSLPYMVIGNGSDLLVGDRGIRGIVIVLRENYSKISVSGNRITAEAGALLKDVALAAADAGLSGLEPLWGIPATVGGACYMNAGAYNAQMADVLETVTIYKPALPSDDGIGRSGSIIELEREDLDMGYRKSRIARDGFIVLGATFALNPVNEAMVRADMETYKQKREEKQPLEMPSAGSTFKRPEGYFAGKLIDDAGLRGYGIGGAQVSEKHCGFIVNADHATAAEVNELIEYVQAEVKRQFGVELETEVKRVGEF